MLRSASSIAFFTLLSRIFGFLRDVVMAATLGAGPIADAFMVAFRLPNHFRAIIGEGAFNSAFVPTYSATLAGGGAEAAAEFRAQILTWVCLANLVLLAVGLGATGLLIMLLAPGFADDPGQLALAVGLTRITFPYLFCLSIVTLLSGALNAHGRFAAAAAAPILLNLAMAGMLLVNEFFPTAGHAAAVGVLLGGLAQLAFLLVATARAGLRLRLPRPRISPTVRVFARRFGPAVLGAGGIQLAVFADTIIATLLPTGSISYLYYADRLYQLPLAVIGIALGTAILPDLSRRIAGGDEAGAAAQLSRALLVALVIGIPSAVILGGLGDWIMQILFARGAFGTAAVEGSAAALAAYAIGLPAAIALRALVSAFHARGDTMTPVKALAAATVVNIMLKLVLIGPLLHAGLAAATAAGAWVYAGSLAVILWHRDRLKPRASEWITAGVSTISGAAMVLVVIALKTDALAVFAPILPQHPLIMPFIVLGGAATLAYAAATAAGFWGGRLADRRVRKRR